LQERGVSMNTRRGTPATAKATTCPSKAATGIAGFDEITLGGLPRGRTTLLVGSPGSGKTIFGLQFLAHGAQQCKEPGIFVAFEESSARIVANAESFGWDLVQCRQHKKLYFMDAQPLSDMVQSGDFDLCGMLSALDAMQTEIKARRIVIDALDVVLDLLSDPATRRREIYRLHEWLLARELTGIITAKADGDEGTAQLHQPFEFMQFMVDCAVILSHSVSAGVSHRNLRVQKYRGSSFDENEAPFLIGKRGLEVAVMRVPGRVDAEVSTERVSSGITRLDTMLGGGYFRGASVLITGFSGTAKSTLSGAFAAEACRRGERTLFVSFDSDCSEIVRNLASVNIQLERHVKNGRLRMISARSIAGSAETYLVRIKTLAQEHRARCLIIDPVSTWYRSDKDLTSQSVADRLIDWSKAAGITLVCTSLLDEMSSRAEGDSSLQISTLTDTWINLSYLVQAGERNRGLSIVKSRGMAHSNQVRELILSDTGVTLADTYAAGGEVLMGTLRWEKERAARIASEAAEASTKLKRVKLDAEEAELMVRLKSLQTELTAKQVEKELMASATLSREGELSRGRSQMKELRGADIAGSGRK
jgi:circadian clock protein KaiC